MEITGPGKYKTRDGRCAVVAGVSAESLDRDTVAGWLDGSVESWSASGEYDYEGYHSENDLIAPWVDPPAPVERWLNIYSDSVWSINPTRELADEVAGEDRIACIKITYTPGEGL